MGDKNETAAAAEAAKAPAAPKDIQNGVTRPKAGTTTGRVWEISDEISAATKTPATRKDVIEKVVAEGINPSTGATQYGKWRKYHGLEGEKAPGRKPKEAAPAAAPEAAPAAAEETV